MGVSKIQYFRSSVFVRESEIVGDQVSTVGVLGLNIVVESVKGTFFGP